MATRASNLPHGRFLWLLVAFVVIAIIAAGTNALREGEESLAKRSELRQIESAVLLMMTHNKINSIPNPVSDPTNDLRRFPDVLTPPLEKGLLAGDKPGYVLYGHDNTRDDLADPAVSYVRFADGRWTYTVAADGTVTQWAKASGD